MSKTIKRVEVSYHWAATPEKYAATTVPAYLTETAGLSVGHTHRLKINRLRKSTEVIKLKTWDIITYPSGHAVLQGFKTKAEAVYCAEHELAKFSWVCMFLADFEKNNKMDEVRKTILEVRKAYSL